MNRHRKLQLGILLLAVLLGRVSLGREIFVNNMLGDDRNGGQSAVTNAEWGPVRTIGRALKIAHAGDRLVLENTGEPYRECVTLQGPRNSGGRRHPFVIEGNGAILDGTGEIPEDRWEHVRNSVFRFRPDHHGHQQLFRNGELLERVLSTQIAALEVDSWLEHAGNVYVHTQPGELPALAPLRIAQHPVGITLYEVDHVVIQDLEVRGYRLDGVNAHDSAFDILIDNVTSRNNGRSGISIGGASRVEVTHCTLANNNESQLRIEGHAVVDVTATTVDSERAPVWRREGGRITVDGEVLHVATP